jgi:tetratricopeptide (TPR) repeat protein
VGLAQLRQWVAPAGEAPYRPFLLIVLDLDHGYLLGTELFQQPPSPDTLRLKLQSIIRKPARGAGPPRRPAAMAFEDQALAEALAAPLQEWQIASQTRPLPEVGEIVRDLEVDLRGGEPERPSLLSVKGVTPDFAGAFFAAAAEFYRAEPWVQLNNAQTFALQIPAGAGPRWIASVMGNGGVEYGLGVYKSWKAFETMFMGAAERPEELFTGHLVVFYGGPEILPFDDYEAIQRFGWEVAGPEAYPVPIVAEAVDQVRRPDLGELRYLEAALRAVPRLVRDHLRPDGEGEYRPIKTTLKIATHGGEVMLRAVYPGGRLSLEQRPVGADAWQLWGEAVDDEEELPAFDRRMMEGFMAQLGEDLGAEKAVSDPKLHKAQEMMYKAWEASNPARRLALAHQALSVSADCADAYVLLAEEEADTLARAANYYRQGIEAGERALGAAYFKENQGYFWGLLETRPYMRARLGLANALWSLRRNDEAIAHYRALLELNPGDNQGVRYSLLNLLLELNRDAEAEALLRQYDEAMAEWRYGWALVRFRQAGPGKEADRRLRAALKSNRHVPAYLTGRQRIPVQLPPYYGFGDEAEAVHYAHRYLNHWRRTPGAVEWLRGKL